jgi:hypothetical protein
MNIGKGQPHGSLRKSSHDQIRIHNICGPKPLVKCAWVGDPVDDESFDVMRVHRCKVKPVTVAYEKPSTGVSLYPSSTSQHCVFNNSSTR